MMGVVIKSTPPAGPDKSFLFMDGRMDQRVTQSLFQFPSLVIRFSRGISMSPKFGDEDRRVYVIGQDVYGFFDGLIHGEGEVVPRIDVF